ncbi:hypothetical protein PC120_g20757 [Phytophthora cactorum]|nr:hypothetical protein PC120_g20757 [Phytophthora cactorum]
MAMGHVDGLSRLPIDRVDALTMANLLDPAENSEDVVEATVGEQEETDHDQVDMCGLDVEPFWAEQPEVAWVRALIAFLEEGALPVGPLLRAQVVKVAPRHSVENGLLMRLVHLPARAGPARSLPFLWCLCRTYRPFYTTVIRTCCRIWD